MLKEKKRTLEGKKHVEVLDQKKKNDNIHKSETLKLQDKRTLTLAHCQNGKTRI